MTNTNTIQAPRFEVGQRVSYRLDDGHVQHGTIISFELWPHGWRYVINSGGALEWVYEQDLEGE